VPQTLTHHHNPEAVAKKRQLYESQMPHIGILNWLQDAIQDAMSTRNPDRSYALEALYEVAALRGHLATYERILDDHLAAKS
jgi:hypothetical protein